MSRKGRPLPGANMSRTMHHVPWERWNITVERPEVRYHFGDWRPQLGTYEVTLGHELWDLRFYAGCKRQPQKIHLVRWYGGYTNTFGHYGGAAKVIAAKQRSRTRVAERAFSRDVSKLVRAGEPVDDLLEPEGRTRHAALWDAV